MILNAYSVLALFVGVVEAVLGVIVAGASLAALRGARSGLGSHIPAARSSLQGLASGALLGVSIAAWPLLYLLLDSYVPQWEGVMCIQGVVRIGTESPGAPGLLPLLVVALQVTKPLLLFAMGAALVVHLVNRKTKTAPLSRNLAAILLAAGLFAIVDASIEVAYVSIPKQDATLARGCCTATAEGARENAVDPLPRPAPRGVFVAFYGEALLLAGWTWYTARKIRRGQVGRKSALLLLLAALGGIPIGIVFLQEAAAPAFLRLPFHHCAYCLVASAPLGLLAIALYLLGVFATGWACIAGWLCDTEEARDFLPGRVASLLMWGLFGWIGAALLPSVQLALP